MSGPKVLIGTPHRRDLTPEYIRSIFWTVGGLTGEGWEFGLALANGCFIQANRNVLLRQFADNQEFSHLLMVDTDMCWQPADVAALMALETDVATALYCMRTKPWPPLVFRYLDGGHVAYTAAEVPREPFEVEGAGTGMLLISRPVAEWCFAPKTMERFGFPFDMVVGNPSEERQTSLSNEDLVFCMRIRAGGFKIVCHPGVRPLHVSHGGAKFVFPGTDGPVPPIDVP